jgi:tetratricopeptide (TPR) repeat protein
MKKDALLFLFAGFVLGSVVTFIVMKSIDQKKTAPAAQTNASQAAPENGAPPEEYNPEQHSSMMMEYVKQAKDDPKNLSARITLGNIYYDRGKFKEAAEWYEEALKLDPKNTDVLVDYGVCCRELKDTKKALELFDRALAVDPKKQQALFNKVIVNLFDLKDIPAAKKCLASLEAVYPDVPMVKQLKDEIEKASKKK